MIILYRKRKENNTHTHGNMHISRQLRVALSLRWRGKLWAT